MCSSLLTFVESSVKVDLVKAGNVTERIGFVTKMVLSTVCALDMEK